MKGKGIMEFVVTGLDKLPQQIDCNFAELQAQIAAEMERYKSIVVTEDSIQAAKATRADLNKFKLALDNERKRIKAEWDKPLKEFESKVKALTALVDEPISLIDSQVKEFDTQRVEAKYGILLEAYSNAMPPSLVEYIPFERVINPKWANVNQNINELKRELSDKIAKIKKDIVQISKICAKYSTPCMVKYCETLDVGDVLVEYNRLMTIDREQAKQAEPTELQTATAEPPKKEPQEELKTFDARFYNTTAQFRVEMRELCRKHGIKYGNVPKRGE